MKDDPPEGIEFVFTAAERITLSVAEEIISKTVQRSKNRGSLPPDPLVLMSVVQRVLADYDIRDFLEAMPSLQSLSESFDRLKRSVTDAREQILQILTKRGISYFFEVTISTSPVDPFVMKRVGESAELLAEVADHAKVVQDELKALLQSGASHWYELDGGSPVAWLYSKALPEIFKDVFHKPYRIPSSEGHTSPGLRFALAMIEVAHLPRIGQSRLRHYALEWSRGRSGEK